MNQIDKAVRVLKKGGVIAYPTETVYGLGANIFNEEAVKKVFKLKGREFKEPLLVAVSSFKMIKDLAVVSKEEEEIIKELLPGPISVILPKKEKVSSLVTAGSEKVGIRLPDNKEAIEIIKKAGFPITSTSANLSGEKPVVEPEQVNLDVDFIVKGKCKYKEPSTVVDLGKKEILRKGPLNGPRELISKKLRN